MGYTRKAHRKRKLNRSKNQKMKGGGQLNMVAIPSFIKKTSDKGNSIHNIPLVIYQTWHSSEVPRRMHDNIMSLLKSNPEFDYRFYTDEDCLKFIKENFDDDVVSAFEMLIPGAFKADLWRYCVLYKNGGVYLDIKYYSTKSFYDIIHESGPIFVKDSAEAQCKDTKYGVYNGFMAVAPNNTVLLDCINDIVESSKTKSMRKNSLDVTGPCLLARKFHKIFPNENFKFQYTNFKEYQNGKMVPMGNIKFNNKEFLKHYIGYRDDQNSLQKTKHYHNLYYHDKKIWNDLVKYEYYIKRSDTSYGEILNNIPLVIYETWHTKNITVKMKETINELLKMNPQFDFYLYDNEACVKFIKDHFEKDVLDAYNCLYPTAFKSDLWRYCILYEKGGVYNDIKFTTVENNSLINYINKYGTIYVKDINKFCNKGIINGFIATPPKNPVFKACIDEIVESYKKRDLKQNVLDITGPCLLGRKLEHLNIFNTTKFTLKDNPKLTIYYGHTLFMKAYDTYKEDRANNQNTKHYGEIYDKQPDQVWCKNN
jgi:mannosyltransferase OCH1-like enzyme